MYVWLLTSSRDRKYIHSRVVCLRWEGSLVSCNLYGYILWSWLSLNDWLIDLNDRFVLFFWTWRSGVVSRPCCSPTDTASPATEHWLRHTDRHGLSLPRRSFVVIRCHGVERPAQLCRVCRALDVLFVALSGQSCASAPTIGGGRHYVDWLSVRPSVRCPSVRRRSVNVYNAWRYISVLSGPFDERRRGWLVKITLSKCAYQWCSASAVKKPGHFEVRKSSSQVTRMYFFSSKKVDNLFELSPSKHMPLTPFHRQNKTNKADRYGNIFIFCSHYYRSKAIRRARQSGARAWVRAVDLPARSFDLARPGV